MIRPATARVSRARPPAGSLRERPTGARSFLSIPDLGTDGLRRALDLAASLKAHRGTDSPEAARTALSGLTVALLFDKPSLRTRTTFEIAIHELGGWAQHVPSEVALAGREPVADVARNLERWVHAAVVRTFAQTRLHEMTAAAPRLSVVNALTDEEHPCQALADMLTLEEHTGNLRGQHIAYIGDGNNVATSLVQAAALLGVSVTLASPEGYGLSGDVIDSARRLARLGARISQVVSPEEAAQGASAVYTDVWTSMGQEREAAERRRRFAGYQVNAELMALARPGALFMHCLPAHRGEEVSAEVMDSPASVVFDQAENRLHTQKAVLVMLLADARRG